MRRRYDVIAYNPATNIVAGLVRQDVTLTTAEDYVATYTGGNAHHPGCKLAAVDTGDYPVGAQYVREDDEEE